MRIRKEILVATWLILAFNLGLIASIDNNIVSVGYILTLVLLGNNIRKRYRIEVR